MTDARIQRRLSGLDPYRFPERWPVVGWTVSRAWPEGIPRPTFADDLDRLSEGAGEAVTADSFAAPANDAQTTWLSTAVTVPDALEGERVTLRFDTEAESMVYVDGAPWPALDENRSCDVLAERGEAGRTYRLDVMLFSSRDRTPKALSAEIVRVDEAVARFRPDLRAVLGVARTLSDGDLTATRLRQALVASTNALDFHGTYGAVDVTEAARVLHEHVDTLLTFLCPERVAGIIRGLVNAYREVGWLPKWMSPGYRDCMIGTHAAAVIADAYTKGIRDFDAEAAYRAVVRDATLPSENPTVGRRGIERYDTLGYVPCDEVGAATSRTLEFATGDWCVARLAEALGHDEDAARFDARALSYRTVFDPDVGFMRGRQSDGSWLPDFEPPEWGGPFTEGSAWHVTRAVPHDPAGLAALLGGREASAEKLDAVFETPGEFRVGSYGFVIHELAEMVRGQMGQYAQCNQPIHHALYLYPWAGQSWKSQRRAREVMDRMDGATPDGLPGDEGNGGMSAWYVLSAPGLYPVAPGSPVYVLGSPLFERAMIRLPNGRTFTIEAPGTGSDTPYVQSACLDGAAHEAAWISLEAVVGSGTLRVEMGPEPNTQRATRIEDAPPSLSPLVP